MIELYARVVLISALLPAVVGWLIAKEARRLFVRFGWLPCEAVALAAVALAVAL